MMSPASIASPMYGGLYCSNLIGIIIARHSKTRACAGITGIKHHLRTGTREWQQ
ncbi:hypothetical protein BDR06DRAFT_951510 [Suillus hirtellus]|nr:hypothetical protein BDR06DRAFT_951510 [Suillus hirtellus]